MLFRGRIAAVEQIDVHEATFMLKTTHFPARNREKGVASKCVRGYIAGARSQHAIT
jgi:hypothetical protein